MLLREKDRVRIIKLAEETIPKPFKILAFGSRVNGKAHDTSDLDLAIVKENTLESSDLSKFKRALRESNIPIIVHVLDFNRVPENFHKNILRENKLLIEFTN